MPIYYASTPEPSDEIVTRLKQIDPNLNLKFVEMPTTEDFRDAHRWWALVLDWEQNDPRRAMIARGDLGNAPYDILGYLPLDCSPAESFGYVQNVLIKQKTRPDVNKFINRLGEFNKTKTADVIENLVDKTEDLAKANSRTLFEEQGKRVPKVFQSGK